jgi:hypothetical protein
LQLGARSAVGEPQRDEELVHLGDRQKRKARGPGFAGCSLSVVGMGLAMEGSLDHQTSPTLAFPHGTDISATTSSRYALVAPTPATTCNINPSPKQKPKITSNGKPVKHTAAARSA